MKFHHHLSASCPGILATEDTTVVRVTETPETPETPKTLETPETPETLETLVFLAPTPVSDTDYSELSWLQSL